MTCNKVIISTYIGYQVALSESSIEVIQAFCFGLFNDTDLARRKIIEGYD